MDENRSITNVLRDLIDIWQDFRFSYQMFPEIYNSGFLIAVLLSVAGVLIVARNQIFIGAAITQTSTFGIAIALSVVGLEAMSDATGQARQGLILRYSIIAAIICSLWAFVDKSLFWGLLQKFKIPSYRSRESSEKNKEDMTGWLFLLASAGAIVLVSKTPLGMEEVKKLTFSSIIGADAANVRMLLYLLLIQLALLLPFMNTIVLTFTDRNYALSLRIPVSLIEVIFALLMGVILGTTLKVSGTLYSFGCLILPVLIAANICTRTRPLFIISPLIGLSSSFIGFTLGGFYNIPQPQLSVFILCVVFPLSFLYKLIFIRS